MNTREDVMQKLKKAQDKYETARKNLLLMLVLTIVNIVLVVVGSDVMMLFSATVPYLAAVFGVVWGSGAFSIACFALAAILLLLYALCWHFSNKKYGWMIVALVLFIIDTLAMIGWYLLWGEFSGILDVVIHVWVLYYLIIGVKYGKQLRTMPAMVETTYVQNEENQGYHQTEDFSTMNSYYEGVDTPALRRADLEVKSRVFLEVDVQGHHICYRRVKKVNELVIDGYVYDDVEMLIESAHALNARINGHIFQVGFDGMTKCYLKVDGVEVESKMRLI